MGANEKICFSRILYATDFSEESAQAASYVRAFQQSYHADVHVAHVLDVLPFLSTANEAGTPGIAEIGEDTKTRLNAFMQAQGFRHGEFSSVILTGEVSIAVEQFAREHHVDLIVLGSHGRVGVDRLFQGSMAEEIFRTAQSPVMVVGPDAKTAGGSFNRLFFPTDLGPISRLALPYIEFMLRENDQAKLALAHFVERDPQTPYERHKVRLLVGRDLIELIDPSLRPRIEDVAVEFSRPAEGMISLAHGLRAELLFLGVRQGGSWTRAATHGLRSITHQVISRSPCPVLTVRGS